jgi:uracil-xanthine permease
MITGATKELQWFGPDSNLAVLLATFLGFQHSLAVVGGTVLPGIILGQLDPSGQAAPFLVSYALITSGICTWIQIAHTPICKTKYFLGSGLLCVIATSFAFSPTAVTSINTQIEAGKSFDEAYGSLLGVFMVGAVFQSGFSFIPGPILRKIFPPWLAGLGVFLIGVSLVGVGVEQWGGGCSPNTVCNVGQSNLLYGSSEYLGLGFLVMCTIVFLELFGSPFLRSCSIAFALLFGYLISALTSDRNGESYTDNTTIKEAPVILFLWVKTFPIGFYSPALIPTLIAYVVSTIETYGDTTATAEASGFIPNDEASGKKFDEAIQGGLLGDSVNSLISALSMVLPSTTLSQNIGIISLTRVAARGAGYACGIWMLIYGVFGKVGAFFTSIPPPVLGGMSTFLFANIATSGIKVMTSEGVNRRARFILAVSGAFGLGTIIVPEWFTSAGFLDCPAIESPGLRGLCDAAVTTLSTGYAVGCLVALILNGILPNDPEGDGADEEGTPLTKDSTLELSCNALVDESDEIDPDSKADEENAISSTT